MAEIGKRPTVTLEFNPRGTFLTAIYFNASTDQIYEALWLSLRRLTGDVTISWIKRLMGRRGASC